MWQRSLAVPDPACHCGEVSRLQWRPPFGSDAHAQQLALVAEDGSLLLASASADHSVRLFRIRL